MNFENTCDTTLDNLPQLVVGCNIVNSSDKDVILKDGDYRLYPQTKLRNITDITTSNLVVNSIDAGLIYSTTVPTSANTDGIKIVVLSEEPATRYEG